MIELVQAFDRALIAARERCSERLSVFIANADGSVGVGYLPTGPGAAAQDWVLDLSTAGVHCVVARIVSVAVETVLQ